VYIENYQRRSLAPVR